jgi:5'-nucleotidase
VNAIVPKLQAQGVQSIVVLIHEGGYAGQSLDDCHGLTGTIADIVPKFDKAVDVVVTGHTNGIYICTVDGRLVTGAGAYGTRVTDIKLMIDPKSGDTIAKSARDIPIRLDAFAEDQSQLDLIAAYKVKAEPLMNRRVGRISAAITRTATAGESALGDVIADSMLETARQQDPRVEIAFMNPGGIRSDLPFKDGGQVTYGDIFTVQPFGNQLVSLTLTGAQIEAVLKQQYHPTGGLNILQVSEGFSFAWRQQPGKPVEIVPGSLTLNGKPIAPAQTYRIVTNNFLAGGGDNFTAFKDGVQNGIIGSDIDALDDYMKAHSPISGSIKGRITRAQ